MTAVSLSQEEEHYVRMSLLLTGIAPHGVRTLFDREFSPSCLNVSMKKEYNKLKDLQLKRVINQSQWNRLFPRNPGVPDSKTFDVTLMITILRHLTSMTPPASGYDCLPQPVEVTQGADLARIKYYRNYLAHLDDGKIDTAFFNTAWTDITDAIDRLGGHTMEQECYQLKTKFLDYSNQEIVMNIKHSEDEIKEIKESLEEFKSSHLKLKKSHELMQKNYEEETKRFSLLQEYHKEIQNSYASLQQKLAKSQQDTVPWNVRAQINKIHEKWKNTDKMFVSTRAAKHVLKLIQDNSCVTITASSGVGKTATLQHVALQMNANDYDILPVTDPRDIIQYYNPNQKTLFVIDDLFGGLTLSQNDIKLWESVSGRIKEIIEDKKTKIVVACRLQVYQDNNFETLSMFNSSVCNLLSLDMCLTKKEKQSIAEVYLETKAIEISDYYDLYDCFPLLCQLYYTNPTQNIKHFFQHPYSVYEAQVDQLQKRCFGKYCALVLCVMFNNKLNEDVLTTEIDEETQSIIENTCETCKLDKGTSRLVLKDEMDSLVNTLLTKQDKVFPTTENNKVILKTKTFYSAIHDKIFHFLVKYFGQKIIDCLIKNADSCLIRETFLLARGDTIDQLITIVPSQYHQLYMQRMTDDWSKGKLQDVFNNKNMKMHNFRQRFLCYLNTLDAVYQKQLVHTRDTNDKKCKRDMLYYRDVICDTVMLHCCSIGDMQMIQWCCNHGVDVNESGICGQSPLMVVCRYGHTDIVRMLLNKAADCNKCDEIGQSPVLIACIHGHSTIVRILIDNGADYSACDNLEQSPLFMACKHEQTDIVKMLLDREADYKKCDMTGQSPAIITCVYGHLEILKMMLETESGDSKCDDTIDLLFMMACKYGHTDIVKMLLGKGANKNTSDILGQVPLLIACKHGHTNIVKILLDIGANYKKCDNDGMSSVMIACMHGHTQIVSMLLDNGANYNACNNNGQSSLMLACIQGQTEIVRMLFEKFVDYDKCDIDEQSPIMMACMYGHPEIVMMLLDNGADYNKCDKQGQSLGMLACMHGHTEIAKRLLDKGAYYNVGGRRDWLPLNMACKYGHTEIVRMLINNGVDHEMCDLRGQSPLMNACGRGHIDVVRILLDEGVDYDKCDLDGQSSLMKASRHGHIDIVRMLLDKGADYDKCDAYCQSSLMKACRRGHSDVVKMLIDRGAYHNYHYDKWNQSPVLLASRTRQIETVQMLLDKGADHNTCDHLGQTPILMACKTGQTEVVRLLLDQGADYNACDSFGQTPILMACKTGKTGLVKMLLDKEVDFRIFDKYGRTPIKMAVKYCHLAVLRMLLDKVNVQDF